ncbi:hypothetical protein M8C21_008832 [Ambrosia artemisiifolia]|uniref:Uncharacterized protein n=1 Tax=Ambrosia artemisiifolia TaxID=4212 RepID=A0AAD5D0B8_AMBAR|nr:hypothetical protein M8C21_008832 [Ambrosia artemisiifolia]
MYKLGGKIGSGSFAEIPMATHVDTFETVAVKIGLWLWAPLESDGRTMSKGRGVPIGNLLRVVGIWPMHGT